MRAKLLFLIILIFLNGCGEFRRQLKEMDFKPELASITSEPTAASVYINDKYVGDTPVKVQLVSLGNKWPENWTSEIKVEKQGFYPEKKRVHLNETKQHFKLIANPEFVQKEKIEPAKANDKKVETQEMVATDLFGFLDVKSNPERADVILDGEFIGHTPLSKLKLKAGLHKIRIETKSYRAWEKAINIISDSNQNIDIELEKK